MNIPEKQKTPTELRFFASSTIVMNIVTDIVCPEEIEEYSASIPELRDMIYTVIEPRKEVVFTEVRILVILLSQPFIIINKTLGQEVLLVLKELYYKYLQSEFYDDLTYYTNQIAPIFDDKTYQDNIFVKELKNFIYLRMATTKYISFCLNAEEWNHSLINILESFNNTKSFYFANLQKLFMERLTNLMRYLQNIQYSKWQLEDMIRSNVLDTKAKILNDYFPGIFDHEADQGKASKRGGTSRGAANAKKGVRPGQGVVQGIESFIADMKSKLGIAKISLNLFEQVMGLIENFKKTPTFKNVCLYEPTGDEDPEDDFEIVQPLAEVDIDSHYQLSLIKKMAQDNDLLNQEKFLRVNLAIDLSPTSIFLNYYTNTEINEFFESFESKMDIDDIVPVLTTIVEMIINDVKKLEQGVQFISQSDIDTFSDQR